MKKKRWIEMRETEVEVEIIYKIHLLEFKIDSGWLE